MWKIQRLARSAYPELRGDDIARVILNHFLTGLRDERFRCAASLAIPSRRGGPLHPEEIEAVASKTAVAYGLEGKLVGERADDHRPGRNPGRGVAAVAGQSSLKATARRRSVSISDSDTDCAEALYESGTDGEGADSSVALAVQKIIKQVRGPRFKGRQQYCRVCRGRGHREEDCANIQLRKKNSRCHECGDLGHYKFECPKNPNRVNPDSASSSANPPETDCFHCGKRGHYRRDCPELNTATEQRHQLPECYGCGETGHMRRDCPNQDNSVEPNRRSWPRSPKPSAEFQNPAGPTPKGNLCAW